MKSTGSAPEDPQILSGREASPGTPGSAPEDPQTLSEREASPSTPGFTDSDKDSTVQFKKIPNPFKDKLEKTSGVDTLYQDELFYPSAPKDDANPTVSREITRYNNINATTINEIHSKLDEIILLESKDNPSPTDLTRIKEYKDEINHICEAKTENKGPSLV